MEKSKMNEKQMLAIMYDFYNLHMLRGQNDDILYYINEIKSYDSKKVLVVGAGTGRVAIPLSKYANVTALDFDQERLIQLNRKEKNIRTICINFFDYEKEDDYDLIVIPYSTLQFDNDAENINKFLKKLSTIINANTISIFDVSESFNTKIDKNQEFLFRDYCREVYDDVAVYYTSKRFKEYIEFLIEYRLCKEQVSLFENEKYYYYDRDLLYKAIVNNNLEILKIDDGYGNADFKHKHLYHCRKRGR